jgi:hypothetical protein
MFVFPAVQSAASYACSDGCLHPSSFGLSIPLGSFRRPLAGGGALLHYAVGQSRARLCAPARCSDCLCVAADGGAAGAAVPAAGGLEDGVHGGLQPAAGRLPLPHQGRPPPPQHHLRLPPAGRRRGGPHTQGQPSPWARDMQRSVCSRLCSGLARLLDIESQCHVCLTRRLRQQVSVLQLWWTKELPCSKKGAWAGSCGMGVVKSSGLE